MSFNFKRRVFVLEDERHMYEEMLKNMFPPSMWSIIWAEKPTEAVKKFEGRYFDCIVIDYKITDGFTGRDFLRWIRTEGGQISDIDNHTPVFLFSQYRGGFEGGFSAYDVDEFNAEKKFIYKEDLKEMQSGPEGRQEVREWTQSLFREAMIRRCTPKLETEYEPLQTVLVHRPTEEVLRVDPDEEKIGWYLLEQSINMEKAQQEHRRFRRTLAESANWPTILEVKRLLFEVIRDLSEAECRDWLSRILLPEVQRLYSVFSHSEDDRVTGRPMNSVLETRLEEFSRLDEEDITSLLLRGISLSEVLERGREDLQERGRQVVHPVPNLYFMRDPAFALGERIFLSQMHWPIRRRETPIMRLIFNKHPFFQNASVEDLGAEKYEQTFSIEGGDLMAIRPGVFAVAESERTDREAAERVAKILLDREGANVVYQPRIPVKRAFIHLDTVCSLAGPDHCVIHPEATNTYPSTLRWEEGGEPKSDVNFVSVLKRELGLSGNGIIEVTNRAEQKQDATNVLMADPSTVIAYDRNSETNSEIESKGLTVARVEGADLVSGLGGPRCMTMPIRRGEV